MIGLKVVGWGDFRPKKQKLSLEIDHELGKEPGWVERNFGIKSRPQADRFETSSYMAAKAALRAIECANWDATDFDVLIGGCGVMEQPIPSTAILVQQKIGLGKSGIPAFDVNQTCLSFMQAFDIAALGFKAGRWKRALIFASDIASAGLNPETPKTYSIFGDGAAALALEATSDNNYGLLASKFESYGEGYELAQIRTGGTRIRREDNYEEIIAGSYFEMNPFGIFKAAARRLPPLIAEVLKEAGIGKNQLKFIACHQASEPGVKHIRRLFAPNSDRVIDIFPTTGNQIAASIPTVLCHILENENPVPGDIVLLLGTAAGVSAGAMVLKI